MTERVLITGSEGFIGSRLVQIERQAGNIVRGFSRRHNEDITDLNSVRAVVSDFRPDRIYNLAALSAPGDCERNPSLAYAINGTGAHNILEAATSLPKVKIFQALTSHQYGDTPPSKITEQTPFNPQSVYARSKDEARKAVESYREEGVNAGWGVIFGAEGEGRDVHFLFGRLALAVAAMVAKGKPNPSIDGKPLLTKEGIFLVGDPCYQKDIMHVSDVAEQMSLMLKEKTVPQLLISSGVAHSVQQFLEAGFDWVGLETWQDRVQKDPSFNSNNLQALYVGDPIKAQRELQFTPRVSFEEMVGKMVDSYSVRYGFKRDQKTYSYR